MAKAKRALDSARLLLAAEDGGGASNRAYYAMFDAARAALVVVDAPENVVSAKTHRGLVNAFGQYLVLAGIVDAAYGRSLNRVQETRIAADYLSDTISTEEATLAVTEADAFVSQIDSVVIKAATR